MHDGHRESDEVGVSTHPWGAGAEHGAEQLHYLACAAETGVVVYSYLGEHRAVRVLVSDVTRVHDN